MFVVYKRIYYVTSWHIPPCHFFHSIFAFFLFMSFRFLHLTNSFYKIIIKCSINNYKIWWWYLFYVPVCGGTYYAPPSSDTSGSIISPGYPGNYGNNLLCNYTIEVDPEDFIMLQFDDDAFYIEGLRKALVANPQHSDNVTSGNGTDGGAGKVGLITDSSGKFIWILSMSLVYYGYGCAWLLPL